MHPGFYVDLRLPLSMYDPKSAHNVYYSNFPRLREVVVDVSLHKIIECSFVLPAADLQEHGLSGALLAYIEHNCIQSLEIFEESTDLLFNFDCLVNDIVETVDHVLRHYLTPYTSDYGIYVFDHWVTPSLACFLKVDADG